MHEEHKKIIIKAIEDGFALKEKYSDHEISSNFNLLLSQLDLFKQIASMTIAILGIGYLIDKNLEINFLITSLIFSILSIIGTISYTREAIDSEADSIKKYGEILRSKVDNSIEKAVEAITSNRSEIYFDYAEQELKLKTLGDRLIYAGEIFTFLFYNSISFLIISFLANKYSLSFCSYVTPAVIFVSYLLSFRKWSTSLIRFLSKPL